MRPRLQTRVLTSRIAHLIRAHGAQPYQILAITFTNKVGQRGQGAKEQQAWGSPALRVPASAAALLPRVFTCHPAGDCSMLAALCPPPHGQAAKEMKERLAAMLGDEAGKELFAGTFHRCGQAAGRGWVRSGLGASGRSAPSQHAAPVTPPRSLCYRILKRHINDLRGSGRDTAFTIYDQAREGAVVSVTGALRPLGVLQSLPPRAHACGVFSQRMVWAMACPRLDGKIEPSASRQLGRASAWLEPSAPAAEGWPWLRACLHSGSATPSTLTHLTLAHLALPSAGRPARLTAPRPLPAAGHVYSGCGTLCAGRQPGLGRPRRERQGGRPAGRNVQGQELDADVARRHAAGEPRRPPRASTAALASLPGGSLPAGRMPTLRPAHPARRAWRRPSNSTSRGSCTTSPRPGSRPGFRSWWTVWSSERGRRGGGWVVVVVVCVGLGEE